MAPRPAIFFVLLALASGACGGKTLGSEVAGSKGNVKVSYSYNVAFVPDSDRKAPQTFSAMTLDGARRMTHSDLAGAVTVVNFWGAWCGECRREQPVLNQVAAIYQPRGVRFLGVDVRDPHKADALAFVDEFKIPYPSLYDDSFSGLKVAQAFGVYAFPSTFVLDARGRIAAKITSIPSSAAELGRVIEKVMA